MKAELEDRLEKALADVIPFLIRKMPASLHKRIKVTAAKKGVTMESLIIETLERGLRG